MKSSSRMKLAKKLKSIKAAGEYLNQDRILQVISAADGISGYLPKLSNHIPHQITSSSLWRYPQTLDVVNEGEEASRSFVSDKENVRPPPSCDRKETVSRGSDKGVGAKSIGSGFRRPDLNSSTLFDPKLLEAFESLVVCFRRINDFSIESKFDEDVIFFPVIEKESIKKEIGEGEKTFTGEEDTVKDENTLIVPLLLEFEERCPPGGQESVVFYTTTIRGIRKTFDECNSIRFLLDSFNVKYYERDVSMHKQYREELRRVSSAETDVLPPVLFVKGRCIGGAQRVLGLHEQGKLKALFKGFPIAKDKICGSCDGFRFVMCGECRGSRRIVCGDASRIQCSLCNENGLIVCVDCSS
ncbi:unnamed protein product [Cochlearia groenlandica]